MCQLLRGCHIFVYLFSEKLIRLYAQCMMHGSRNYALKWVRQSRIDVGYCDGVAPSGL
jgi:hypothetical protein